jgi:DNA-binding NarL/FixJ family response regulator
VKAPVRVLLVEDQTLVREGLVSLLSFAKDLEVAGQAADGDEALERIERLRPDVVLLDIRLPKRNGLEVLQEAGRRGTLPPTIILTTFDDDALLFDALRAGARGFLLKDVTFDRLTAAIREVAAACRAPRERSRAPRSPSGSPRASARCCGCSRRASRTGRSAMRSAWSRER